MTAQHPRHSEVVNDELPETFTLGARAYWDLEEMIVTGELPPGAVLTEAMLAGRLSMGRTPVREALQRLATDGLVVVLPRRGILVSDIDIRKQLKLLEVRRELEALMVRLAVKGCTASQRGELVEIARNMAAAAAVKDGVAFVRLDRRLNALLMSAADNEYLQTSMGLMQGLSRRFWFFFYESVADLALCARLHADLARAVAAGDANTARNAIESLSDFNETFTRASLDAKPARSADARAAMHPA